MGNKYVDSKVFSLKVLFENKYQVDFYQREYVWQQKQIEDLILDLSTEFLKNWNPLHKLEEVEKYDPYYMGEIVLSLKDNQNWIIDGQQRITTMTLLLIYLRNKFSHIPRFPKGDIDKLIYSDYYGSTQFNLYIPERNKCMLDLFENKQVSLVGNESVSVKNIVNRYKDFTECWNDKINDQNVVAFTYWLKEKVFFSKVWTNSDEFAYVIFETMNDRGLSLTQVEMLRSYLLAKIDEQDRKAAMLKFDSVVRMLIDIKLASKSKAEFEFFKIYFRSHFAEDFSQAKNSTSDFVRIGKEFHRWVRDNEKKLNLTSSQGVIVFIDQIKYFADVYNRIYKKIQERKSGEDFYLIVNSDYNFTLQPALILSTIKYNDSVNVVDEKIKIVSRYLTKVLTWRVWNHYVISQSNMEMDIYTLCSKIRNMNENDLKAYLNNDPISIPSLNNAPTLNQQNGPKLKVLLALITEIISRESGVPDYMLNKNNIEIEHIWSDHYEEHKDEFSDEASFDSARNSIGDLLLLPKSFNASYGDKPYDIKVQHYFGQNLLAKSLNKMTYTNNPGFIHFMNTSGLDFKSYERFRHVNITERAMLYKDILMWNWK